MQTDTSAIVTLKKSGIDNPKGLDGKKYASYGARYKAACSCYCFCIFPSPEGTQSKGGRGTGGGRGEIRIESKKTRGSERHASGGKTGKWVGEGLRKGGRKVRSAGGGGMGLPE